MNLQQKIAGKRCRTCAVTFPADLDHFYKSIHALRPDCKKCHNAKNAISHRRNYSPGKQREKTIKRVSEGRSRECSARMQKKHPEKYRARVLLRIAVGAGKVKKQPCGNCGEVKTEAHHDDYSKPLDVRWLCKPCHSKTHRKHPQP
jgi:ribosomal protein S27AE